MKKSALLAAALVFCTANAWAYENTVAGFSVKDNDPFYKMESVKLYAYSGFSTKEFAKITNQDSASVHIINHYNAGEMQKILGQGFSTVYFEAEYEKLALLKRAEIDMRTVPSPLLDMNKYQAVKADGAMLLQKELLMQRFGKLEPNLRIDKLGQFHVMTESYLYKQDKNLVEVDISLLSSNDNLYMLTSVTTNSKYYADKKDALGEEANLSKHTKIEAVSGKDLPVEVSKKLWQKHLKFVKGFKVFQPTKRRQELAYTDTASGKSMHLPHDWVYGQIQFKEKAATGCLTMAAPVQNLERIFAKMDYLGLYDAFDIKQEPASEAKSPDDFNLELPDIDAQAKAKAKEEARKVLQNFDSLLMTLSYQTKDEDFVAMAESALAGKQGADMLLAETLNSLKNGRFDNFALESFAYKLNFTPSKAGAVITARTKWLNEFTYDNLLELDLTKNAGSVLLYAHKPDVATAEELEKSMREWQF